MALYIPSHCVVHACHNPPTPLSLSLSFALSLSPSLALSLLPVINSYLPACESGRGSASAPSRPEQSPLDTGWKLMATTPANSTDRRPIRRLRSKSETPYLIEARLSSSMRTGKNTSIQLSCSQIFLLDVFSAPLSRCRWMMWVEWGDYGLKYAPVFMRMSFHRMCGFVGQFFGVWDLILKIC